jgi:hypothetical protein
MLRSTEFFRFDVSTFPTFSWIEPTDGSDCVDRSFFR